MKFIDRVLLRKKIIFVGLPKTGSTSTASILNSDITHEYMHKDFSLRHYKLKNREISVKNYNEFLVNRLKSLPTNYDVSTFNYLNIDFLAENLPNNKYLFPIRPFEDWLNSFINHVSSDTHLYGDYDWHNKLGKALMGSWFTKSIFNSEKTIQENSEVIIPNLAKMWNEGIEMVLKNKPSKTLIYRYSLISENINFLSEFVNVQAKNLNLNTKHKNKAHFNTDYASLNKQLVSKVKESNCGGALMELKRYGINNIEDFEYRVL